MKDKIFYQTKPQLFQFRSCGEYGEKEQNQKRGMARCGGSESDSDFNYHFVTSRSKRYELMLSYYLKTQPLSDLQSSEPPYTASPDLSGRPYVLWCERRTLSEKSGKAFYSIRRMLLFKSVHFVTLCCLFCVYQF